MWTGWMHSLDYNTVQDGVVAVAVRPYNYVVHEVPSSTKLLIVASIIVLYGILIPLIASGIRWIRAIFHPITFPYKHVLITGCQSGLGKSLVQEVFMKGAYITMIGRDRAKMMKLAESVDVSVSDHRIIDSRLTSSSASYRRCSPTLTS
jgi:hypothetical protein